MKSGFDLDLASPTRRIPPIHCLLTFEALAKVRSVTSTANSLCVAPSTVSQRIRLLEQILGEPMFHRHDFSLTSAGSAYLENVKAGLQFLRISSR